MNPTPSQQQQLRDGIQAIRQGDLEGGRLLLLQVVAVDDQNEPAWLWLSRALSSPADQLTALENALRLNPGNTEARERAQGLRRLLGLEPARAPSFAPPDTAPAAPPASDDALDNDPDQCPYCGKLTEPEAEACPFCGRSMLLAGRTDEAGSYRWLVFTSAAILQFSILEPGLALARVVVLGGSVSTFISSALFYSMLGRILLWLAGFFVIIASQAAAPVAGLTVTIFDAASLWLGVALGWSPPQLAALLAALDLPILILGVSTLLGRAHARVRQHVVLDRDAYGHVELNRRGRRYAQQGKWALAALHFQRAMVLGPRFAAYYKDLSAAQARLGRYGQAARTLEAGIEMNPEDKELTELMAALQNDQAVAKK